MWSFLPLQLIGCKNLLTICGAARPLARGGGERGGIGKPRRKTTRGERDLGAFSQGATCSSAPLPLGRQRQRQQLSKRRKYQKAERVHRSPLLLLLLLLLRADLKLGRVQTGCNCYFGPFRSQAILNLQQNTAL